MKRNPEQFARITINGKSYLVFRDFSVEGMTKPQALSHVLRRLILTETNKNKTVIGDIVFYLDILLAYSWETDEETRYGSNGTVEFALANLLPHLPLGINYIENMFRNSQHYFAVEFSDTKEGLAEDKNTYFIKLKDNFFKTAQEIVFKDGVSDKQVQREILQILFNALKENPDTYMRLTDLQSSVPITTSELKYQLYLLKEEDKVEFVTESSDTQKIISVKIKAKGRNELETRADNLLQSPQMVKNVYGISIENTTHGSNSPITVSIDEIKTYFVNLQKEINEYPEQKDKAELSKTVAELETEITGQKNPNKIIELLDRLKNSAGWVYDKIRNNFTIIKFIFDIFTNAGQPPVISP